jgi:hypothetical protein
MKVTRVECYAGYKGEQYPRRFALGDKLLEVEQLEDQWYSPSSQYFRIRAADGHIYILRHDQEKESWSLEAYRSPQSAVI